MVSAHLGQTLRLTEAWASQENNVQQLKLNKPRIC